MREILFRGKGLDNGEWVEGHYVRCRGRHYILPVYDSDHGFDERYSEWIEVVPETVCQYTGMDDRSGRKIFERDIFKYHFNDSIIGIVRYGEYQNTFNDDEFAGHAGFHVEWRGMKDRLRKDLGYWIKISEISGNIFGNPELLKGGDTH